MSKLYILLKTLGNKNSDIVGLVYDDGISSNKHIAAFISGGRVFRGDISLLIELDAPAKIQAKNFMDEMKSYYPDNDIIFMI